MTARVVLAVVAGLHTATAGPAACGERKFTMAQLNEMPLEEALDILWSTGFRDRVRLYRRGVPAAQKASTAFVPPELDGLFLGMSEREFKELRPAVTMGAFGAVSTIGQMGPILVPQGYEEDRDDRAYHYRFWRGRLAVIEIRARRATTEQREQYLVQALERTREMPKLRFLYYFAPHSEAGVLLTWEQDGTVFEIATTLANKDPQITGADAGKARTRVRVYLAGYEPIVDLTMDLRLRERTRAVVAAEVEKQFPTFRAHVERVGAAEGEMRVRFEREVAALLKETRTESLRKVILANAEALGKDDAAVKRAATLFFCDVRAKHLLLAAMEYVDSETALLIATEAMPLWQIEDVPKLYEIAASLSKGVESGGVQDAELAERMVRELAFGVCGVLNMSPPERPASLSAADVRAWWVEALQMVSNAREPLFGARAALYYFGVEVDTAPGQ